MSVEEELKKDHSDMQAVVDSKQKIIDAQVSLVLTQCADCSSFTCIGWMGVSDLYVLSLVSQE